MHEATPLKGLKEREICPVDGCSGDARYYPPGKGHMEGCYYPHESKETREKFFAEAARRYNPEAISIEPEDFELTEEQASRFYDNTPVTLEAQPSTESKIIISLLMRIYDVQMALLTKVDPDTADRIYDAHEAGRDFNPTIYIPEIKDNE